VADVGGLFANPDFASVRAGKTLKRVARGSDGRVSTEASAHE
jgi:hypothetical protein